MEHTLDWAKDNALDWTNRYGYGAVVPALLLDPGGVPWPWIFLMLLAGKAGLNIPLLMLCGFAVLTVVDHALYWIAALGRKPLMHKIEARWPRFAESLEKAEAAVRQRGLLAVTIGRFLPFVGRWVGAGAGLADVPWARFALLDALGVAITVVGFGLAAHMVGVKTIDSPWFHQMVGGAFVLGTVLTLIAIFGSMWHARRKQRLEQQASVAGPREDDALTSASSTPASD
jgi:membrane protein DedA with SNARE-associated domain